jgi:hypothetical protein
MPDKRSLPLAGKDDLSHDGCHILTASRHAGCSRVLRKAKVELLS